MPSRPLVALDAPETPDELPDFLRRLDVALLGNGPALLPLPARPGNDLDRLRTFVTDGSPRVEGSVALVVPTSGSTGDPRLVKLTASALLTSARTTHEALSGPGHWLLALPATHVAGLQVLVRSLVAGTEPVVVDRRDGFSVEAFTAAAATLSDLGPRYTALVPTQLARLLDADPAPLRQFAAVLVGGGPLPDHLLARARAAEVEVVGTYGMTETCGGVVYDGHPLPGTQVELDGWGRIRLRGPTLFSGYLAGPSGSADSALRLADTWFTTADLGRFDNDGRLEVVGRTDDVLITGGVNVAPAAVEAVLADHPRVQEVCVVGVDDSQWGQRVTAVVQGTAGGPAPTLEELQQFAGDRLPVTALPRALVVVPEIPMLPSGKPDRVALRSLLAADPSSQ